MSTEINIKKRIDIQEEGVSITPDVNSINFIGAGVTASTVGDNVTVNVQGSVGATAYYLNETVTQAPYKEFSSIPTLGAEQTIATVVGAGATATIQSFQTPSGVPNTTNIPAGLWQFYLHFSGTSGDSWDVYAEVYKRDLGGIETLLLTTDTIPTTTLTAIPTMILTDGVFPASTVLTTDRIVVKVLATNTGVAGQTITFHTEGSTNYSVGTTTLNQIVPTGAVTSVTGTAPVVSSGGTAPAISMPQANGTTDGYLDSADWTTFNNKVDDNIYTADGTVAGDRQVDLAGNDLFFNDGLFASTFRFNSDDGSSSTLIDAGPSGISIGTSGGGTGKNINVTTTQISLDSRFTVDTTKNTSAQNLDVNGQTKTTTFQMTTTPTAGYVLTSDASGNGTWTAAAGGLTEFTELETTAAPNATVPVNSLTPVTATTNADFAIVPKGNGALLANIPDNTTTGGNKRGTNAIDLQTTRTNANQVASGNNSIVIGANSRASANQGVAIGTTALASNSGFAVNSNGSVTGSTATASGAGSIALNGGLASNNWSFSIGRSTASGINSFAQGGYYAENTASGDQSVAFGETNISSSYGSASFGLGNTSSSYATFCTGIGSSSGAIYGRMAHSSGKVSVAGDSQKSTFTLGQRTTNTTATTLISYYAGGTTPSAVNQVILSNNSSYRFKGTIIGKQSGSTNVAAVVFVVL